MPDGRPHSVTRCRLFDGAANDLADVPLVAWVPARARFPLNLGFFGDAFHPNPGLDEHALRAPHGRVTQTHDPCLIGVHTHHFLSFVQKWHIAHYRLWGARAILERFL